MCFSSPVIYEACEDAFSLVLYFLDLPLIIMVGPPCLTEMWVSKMSVFRGRHGEEEFWHLFQVLFNFRMNYCQPRINYTWTRSKSKHSLGDFDCLVLEFSGTRPQEITVQSRAWHSGAPGASKLRDRDNGKSYATVWLQHK